MHCSSCGFRFFDRGVSNQEAAAFYQGYRSENYFINRRRWEPFYTRSQHQAIVASSRSPRRRAAIRHCLMEAGIGSKKSVLDYGGVDGFMIADYPSNRRAVFDISGSAAVEGVEAIRTTDCLGNDWNLILTCQVLEHVADPSAYLTALLDRLTDTGHLYVEIPNEQWQSSFNDGALRLWWLNFLLRNKLLLILIDTLSTVGRIKLGRIPVFGFMSMREHVNFFTHQSMKRLASRLGTKIIASGINEAGSLFVILQKPPSNA